MVKSEVVPEKKIEGRQTLDKLVMEVEATPKLAISIWLEIAKILRKLQQIVWTRAINIIILTDKEHLRSINNSSNSSKDLELINKIGNICMVKINNRK